MRSHLTVKITTKSGKVLEVQQEVRETGQFVDNIAAHGFLDRRSACYYPPNAILGIAVSSTAGQPEGVARGN